MWQPEPPAPVAELQVAPEVAPIAASPVAVEGVAEANAEVAAYAAPDDVATAPEEQPAPAEAPTDSLSALQSVVPSIDTLAAQVIASGGIDAVDFEISGDSMDHGDVLQHARETQDQLQAHADAFVTSHGVEDVQRFYAWAREHRLGETRSAMLRLFHSRGDVSAFSPLLAEFGHHARRTKGPTQRAAEVDARARDKEPVMVDGLRTTYGAARRAGLL